MSYTDRRSAPDDLDWYYSRAASVDVRAIPIERGAGGPPEDPERDRIRKGRIDAVLRAVIRREPVRRCVWDHDPQCADPTLTPADRRCPGLKCVEVSIGGAWLEWALRSYHGGPVDLVPVDRMAVAFLALLTGAANESDEARMIAARRHYAEAKAALAASKKANGSARARRIDKGIARRDLEEAARVLAIVYGSPVATAFAPSREQWGALKLETQRGAMARVHAAALAAYREAGG